MHPHRTSRHFSILSGDQLAYVEPSVALNGGWRVRRRRSASALAAPQPNAWHQLGGLHTERPRQLFDRLQSSRSLCPLKQADMGTMQSGPFGKLLLRETPFLPKGSDESTEVTRETCWHG